MYLDLDTSKNFLKYVFLQFHNQCVDKLNFSMIKDK